jgi:hypothetical protein
MMDLTMIEEDAKVEKVVEDTIIGGIMEVEQDLVIEEGTATLDRVEIDLPNLGILQGRPK